MTEMIDQMMKRLYHEQAVDISQIGFSEQENAENLCYILYACKLAKIQLTHDMLKGILISLWVKICCVDFPYPQKIDSFVDDLLKTVSV